MNFPPIPALRVLSRRDGSFFVWCHFVCVCVCVWTGPCANLPDDYLALFGGPQGCRVEWQDEQRGLFRLVLLRHNDDDHDGAAPPNASALLVPPVPPMDVVLETPSVLVTPTMPAASRCRDPPSCLHGRPAVHFTVQKRDSANIGRVFYVCANTDDRRCSFFRWQDEMDNFSAPGWGRHPLHMSFFFFFLTRWPGPPRSCYRFHPPRRRCSPKLHRWTR